MTEDTFYGKTYSYDAVDNRNPLINTYNLTNQLLSDPAYTYEYDDNGNLVKKTNKITLESTQYEYNSEDQLIQVTQGSSITKYRYDALGRRIYKDIDGIRNLYAYNGANILFEIDDISNPALSTYTHGAGIDRPVILERNGQKYYYQADHLGSITAITDDQGTIVQSYEYDSFGNIINSSGTITQPFTYTGREYDAETGLFYYRARYMDPKAGRFLQEDPIWNNNLYVYCFNNPLNLLDPYGLFSNPSNWAPFNMDFGADYNQAAWQAFKEGCIGWGIIFELDAMSEATYNLMGAHYGAKYLSAVANTGAAKGLINVIMYKTIITPRASLGADGGMSQMVHTVNRFTGATIKVVHQVIINGKIIHSDVKFP